MVQRISRRSNPRTNPQPTTEQPQLVGAGSWQDAANAASHTHTKDTKARIAKAGDRIVAKAYITHIVGTKATIAVAGISIAGMD